MNQKVTYTSKSAKQFSPWLNTNLIEGSAVEKFLPLCQHSPMNPKQSIDFSCFKTLIVLIYIYNNYSLYFNIIYLVKALKLLITNQWGVAAVPRLDGSPVEFGSSRGKKTTFKILNGRLTHW
jgi:hypothetical protein